MGFADWGRGRTTSESRYRTIPLHRRWINDIVHFGMKAHVMGATWRINLAPLLAARAAGAPAIGWGAIWLKALALVGRRRPELRTAYLPFPWAHFYVHPECVGSVVIERTWRGAAALFFEQIKHPDRISLGELDRTLRSLRQIPVESNGSFRRLIRWSKPPVLVRRLLWSAMLYWWGPLRAKCTGTYAINSFPTGGSITQSAMPISFLLYYGLVEPNGDTEIHVMYDHRVVDGVEIYRIVRDLEATINRDIVAELREQAAAADAEAPLAPATQ
jgi:hypothetical protein